jgi:hypothetical protein
VDPSLQISILVLTQSIILGLENAEPSLQLSILVLKPTYLGVVAKLLLPRAFGKITKLSFKTHNALQQIRLVAHGFTYFVFVLGLSPLRPFILAERTLASLVELPLFFP